MSLFNFDEGSRKPRKNRKLLAFISIAAIAGAVSLSTTLAAKLTLNTNGLAEFGQGVISTTSCDTGGIKVTPINSFFNQQRAGTFTFNAIQVEQISANCAGKDLIIKVLNQDGQALEITNNDGVIFTEARVYYQPFTDLIQISENEEGEANTVSLSGYWAEQFSAVGPAPISVGTLTNLIQINPEEDVAPGSSATEFFELDLEENAFQITFDPSGELAAGFADSKNVYYISIESVNHGD
jgi:hypothetical protein